MLMEYLKMRFMLALFSGLAVFIFGLLFALIYALILKIRKRKDSKNNE